jgi:glycosyltransferase involved in cell wall biosynthesis
VFWLISQIEDDRAVSVLCDLLATKTIACSAAADASLPTLGRRRAPHTIVPYPIDPRFDSVAAASPLPPPLIVSTARLEPSKGHMLLLDGFAIVRQRVPDARLRIIGGDQEGHEAYADELRQRARDIAPDGAISFTGWADFPESHMHDATVYVCSSRIEGLGIAIVEAMACGLPAVITANTGMAEFVEDGRSALVVPNDDPAALADAVVRLLQDPDLAARIAAAGLATSRQFAIDTITAATAAVLDEMLVGTATTT